MSCFIVGVKTANDNLEMQRFISCILFYVREDDHSNNAHFIVTCPIIINLMEYRRQRKKPTYCESAIIILRGFFETGIISEEFQPEC